MSLNGAYKVLYHFTDWVNSLPAPMMEATDGNMYGVAEGWVQVGGVPSLFQITPAGQFTKLYTFNTNSIGTCPCTLLQASDGKIYGTSLNGGAAGIGTVWVWDLGLPKPLPKVKSIFPASGAVGANIIISGGHLLGATAVSFNGTPATVFSSISADFISVTVPPGATTGPVTVTTQNGSITSPSPFTVK
jgi:hypothetical protein